MAHIYQIMFKINHLYIIQTIMGQPFDFHGCFGGGGVIDILQHKMQGNSAFMQVLKVKYIFRRPSRLKKSMHCNRWKWKANPQRKPPTPYPPQSINWSFPKEEWSRGNLLVYGETEFKLFKIKGNGNIHNRLILC